MADLDSPSSAPVAIPANETLQERVAKDALAAVVVFLVALPLCMGVAIASGAPVAAGLITGIIGGIVVGSLAGSPLQVSGPAAGLTVIVFQQVQAYGYASLGPSVLIAGVVQLVAGSLKFGQWFRAVSPAVIHGMLAGIGVLIFSSQFHVMMDHLPKKNGLANIAAIPQSMLDGLPLPTLSTTEERKLQQSLIAELRGVSSQQAVLAKLASPPVADHGGHGDAADDGPAALPADRLASLRTAQPQIIERLAKLSEKLKDYSSTQPAERKAQLEEAAATAAQRTRTALDALADPAATISIQKSQQAASDSLTKLFGQHKDHTWAAKLGLITIVIIVLWSLFVPKKLKLVPGPLIAIVVVTAAAVLLSLPVVFVDVPGNLFAGVSWPSLAMFQEHSWRVLLSSGLVIAVVASAETLLCATAVDQMHSGPRTNYDKELAAQGVGNILCGLLSALPMTGVIVRSSANVLAGARTRLSAILHGVWLLIFSVGFASLLRMIPTSSLAAILVYTGFKLVNPKTIQNLRKYGWGEVAIYFITVIVIVVEDLLMGVVVGIVLSALKLLLTFSHLETKLVLGSATGRTLLELKGAATFLRLPQLAAELEKVPTGAELHVDLDGLQYIDHACLDLIMNWGKQHEATGGQLFIDWETLHGCFRHESNGASAKA